MKFRIIKIEDEYFPQVFRPDPASWVTISNLGDRLSLNEAENAIKRFYNENRKTFPEIVKEFEFK